MAHRDASTSLRSMIWMGAPRFERATFSGSSSTTSSDLMTWRRSRSSGAASPPTVRTSRTTGGCCSPPSTRSVAWEPSAAAQSGHKDARTAGRSQQMGSLRDLIESLVRIPGRHKAMLFFTHGPEIDMLDIVDYKGGVLGLAGDDAHAAMMAATPSNLRIYPIDPAGLSPDHGAARDDWRVPIAWRSHGWLRPGQLEQLHRDVRTHRPREQHVLHARLQLGVREGRTGGTCAWR